MNSNTPHELANLRGATADRHLTAQAHDAAQARIRELKTVIAWLVECVEGGYDPDILQEAVNEARAALKEK